MSKVRTNIGQHREEHRHLRVHPEQAGVPAERQLRAPQDAAEPGGPARVAHARGQRRTYDEVRGLVGIGFSAR